MMPDPEKAAAANEIKLAKEGITRLQVGDAAPPITTQDSAGQVVDLQALLAAGHYVLLFVYPVNEAPNATKHILALDKAAPSLKIENIDTFVINPGTREQGQAYFAKYKMMLPLLDDPGHTFANALGCILPGGEYPQRTLIGIAPDGKIKMYHRGFPATPDPTKFILKQMGLGEQPDATKPAATAPETTAPQQTPAGPSATPATPPAGQATPPAATPTPPAGQAKPPAAPPKGGAGK
jgi:peroxiredoxin